MSSPRVLKKPDQIVYLVFSLGYETRLGQKPKVRQSRKQIMVSSILQKKTNVGIGLCTENYPHVRFRGQLRILFDLLAFF